MASKQQLIEQIRQERAGWEALLAEIGEAQMTQPNTMGDWSFKDVLVHLTAWWQREVARLEAARRGERPAGHPSQPDVQVINQWTYEINKYRPLPVVLQQAQAAWQGLENAVQQLTEEELVEPGRFPWLEGQALGPGVLDGFFQHLHEEHEPLIRAWLKKTAPTRVNQQ